MTNSVPSRVRNEVGGRQKDQPVLARHPGVHARIGSRDLDHAEIVPPGDVEERRLSVGHPVARIADDVIAARIGGISSSCQHGRPQGRGTEAQEAASLEHAGQHPRSKGWVATNAAHASSTLDGAPRAAEKLAPAATRRGRPAAAGACDRTYFRKPWRKIWSDLSLAICACCAARAASAAAFSEAA